MNKTLPAILSVLTLFNCHGQADSKSVQHDLKKLSWLEGTWNRTDIKEGRTAHERWTRQSASEWQGWGVTLAGKDTTFVEGLRIVLKDNTLYYVADVEENPRPVYFRFIKLVENGFACENPDHDFPKKIEYVVDGDSLKVTISDNEKSRLFRFLKN